MLGEEEEQGRHPKRLKDQKAVQSGFNFTFLGISVTVFEYVDMMMLLCLSTPIMLSPFYFLIKIQFLGMVLLLLGKKLKILFR